MADDSLEWMVVSAELHRELGEFEQAISLLDRIPKDWFLFSMAEQIHHHAEQHDCRVFILDNPESQYRRIPSKECEGEICKESEESIRDRMRIERERVAFDEDDDLI